MKSTMQDFPLTLTSLFRRGRSLFGDSDVVSFQGHTSPRATFATGQLPVAEPAAERQG
ncbi:MAG TPA: hypothetical protein VKF59_06110 [Candidatus Dormibacteraeota bacterium]|nr:hypothetical protein [Candidatus Dormibacteraeota bacterium]